eukprot:412584-Rhodomonas_salina.1
MLARALWPSHPNPAGTPLTGTWHSVPSHAAEEDDGDNDGDDDEDDDWDDDDDDDGDGSGIRVIR